jgi:hypothetical protein
MLEEQKENETDIQASDRYDNYYFKRENSIIIDLFHGQYQNIIQCTKCFTESKTYDPYNYITLPIPREHNFYIIKFFTEFKCKYITMTINSETTFGELIKKATKFLNDGNKVKITVRFRGRELNYVKLGEEVLNEFIESLSDVATPEKKPVLEGKNMFIILAKKADK